MIGNLYNSVYNSRLHLLGNSVSDEQVYRAGDPNINGSTDPTPAQLAKDHDNHPFHTLAGATAASYLVHPYDTSWQDQTVRNWAQAHPNQVKRGESSTEWEALRKEHEQEIRENIKKISNMSQSTWDYLNKNYEVIFGEKNKVKR